MPHRSIQDLFEVQGIPQSNSPGKERMLELSCPAVNVSQLLDMRMPAIVLNDPKMDRGIRIDNQVVDQLLNRWQRLALVRLHGHGRKRGTLL